MGAVKMKLKQDYFLSKCLKFSRKITLNAIDNYRFSNFLLPAATAQSLRAEWSGDRIPVRTRFSEPVLTGPVAHPASCTMGTASFPGVNSGRCVTLTTPPSSAVVKKE